MEHFCEWDKKYKTQLVNITILTLLVKTSLTCWSCSGDGLPPSFLGGSMSGPLSESESNIMCFSNSEIIGLLWGRNVKGYWLLWFISFCKIMFPDFNVIILLTDCGEQNDRRFILHDSSCHVLHSLWTSDTWALTKVVTDGVLPIPRCDRNWKQTLVKNNLYHSLKNVNSNAYEQIIRIGKFNLAYMSLHRLHILCSFQCYS